MSGLFQVIDNETAIIREGGVYKEAQLAVRGDGELYAKAKGGFVRLYANGSTSAGEKCAVDHLSLDVSYFKCRLGKLCITAGVDEAKRKPLSGTPEFLQLSKD